MVSEYLFQGRVPRYRDHQVRVSLGYQSAGFEQMPLTKRVSSVCCQVAQHIAAGRVCVGAETFG